MSIKIYVKYVKNNRDFHTTKLNLPTGALDSVSAKQLLELLNELNIEEHTTILMVTYDPVSASYGNRVLFLKDGYLRKELCKDNMNRKSFYHAILAEISLGEGEQE